MLIIMFFRVVKILILLVILAISIIAIFYFNNPHSLVYIYVGGDDKTVWLETKYIPLKKIISDTDDYKFSETAQWSPNDRYFSYYDFVRQEWLNKEWALKIFDARFLATKTVFIGPDKTGEYEWLDNNTVKVCVGAGSGVRQCRSIDINVEQPVVAVDDYASGAWHMVKTF